MAKFFMVRATTWVFGAVTDSFYQKVSQNQMRDLGNPKMLEPRHLIALGFTPERYQVVQVLVSRDSVKAVPVAQWEARKSRWPWSKKLHFRPIRATEPFLIGAGRSKPA